MNRTIFISALVLITIIVFMASLPEKLYKADDKTFLIVTAIVAVITLVILGMYLYVV